VQVLTKDIAKLNLEFTAFRDAAAEAEPIVHPGGAALSTRTKRQLSAKGTKAFFLETLTPLKCDLLGRLEVNLPVLSLLHACGLRQSATAYVSSVSGVECVSVEHASFRAPRRASPAYGGRAPLPLQVAVSVGATDAVRSRAPMPPLGVSRLPLLNAALVPAQGQLSSWMRSSHALSEENSGLLRRRAAQETTTYRPGLTCWNALQCPRPSLKSRQRHIQYEEASVDEGTCYMGRVPVSCVQICLGVQ
jgi:hypothetical protein